MATTNCSSTPGVRSGHVREIWDKRHRGLPIARRCGDLCVAVEADGLRFAQYLDAERTAICWGDVVKPVGPRESFGGFRELLAPGAAALVGSWYPTMADATRAMEPYVLRGAEVKPYMPPSPAAVPEAH